MHIQDLGGEWEVSCHECDDWFPAAVPGTTHTDLRNAGRIPDPFAEDNEHRLQWIGETDWIYRRAFDADEALFEHDKVYLECDGLDTLAEVKLNGEPIALTDNMFRRYRIDVTGRLFRGRNVIEILFMSPVNYTCPLVGGSDLCICPSVSLPGSPYVRKAAYHWGWDWGPSLVTAGIWRPIRLVGYSGARIEDVHIRQRHSANSVTVTADIRFSDVTTDEPISIRGRLISPSGEVIEQIGGSRIEFVVEKPKLWWPNGYGEQPIYELQVALLASGSSPSLLDGEAALQVVSRRIGLRTIELVQEPDQWGKTFYFRVNGVPIFAKGANWIPAHQFAPEITDEWYRDLIESAAHAHMNMLRVWGGGYYEDDRFYDLCDEYGILVWQDFMFSCAHYPSHSTLLADISMEVADNIRRIRHHPSLALWCGNNEMEWGVCDWWPEDKEARQKEYARIFHDLIPKLVAEHDPDTEYWPSSPASTTPFACPNCETEGDGHYWDVWHGRMPFTAYRDHHFRFMSEFGFQSLPSMHSVKTFAEEKDWNMTSHVMECHQKNPAGNGLILHYMAETFRFPKDFPMTVYVAQILQAEAIRYGVEHWRRYRNDFRCMGTLYWQLNDCWPVASWSSIEFNRHWKALQYYARRFFAPVLLSAQDEDASVKLHVTNDRMQPFRGTVLWSLETLDGMPLDEAATTVEVAGGSSACVADLDFAEHLDMDSKRSLVFVYELREDDSLVSRAMIPFAPSKHMELPQPGISTTVTEVGGEVVIQVSAEKAARFVMLDMESHDLRFSDNFFDIPAGRSVEVSVTDTKGLTAKEIEAGLKVISLRDSY